MNSLDYRTILIQEFEHRSEKNPHYSLRAFARDLKVAPSHLSGIFKGKLGLSRVSALEIGKALGMSKNEVTTFIDLVEAKHARNKAARILAKKRLLKQEQNKKSKIIDLDHFRFVSNWYHLALLELSYLKNFSPDIRWISTKLGITPKVSELALNRLKRMGLIRTTEHTWNTTDDWSLVSGDTPSMAIKSFHHQILKKANSSLDFNSIDDRDFRSTIMAIRKDKMNEAKIALKKFHEDFCQSIGEGDSQKYSKDEVYCLMTSFIPLTKLNKEMQ